MRNFSLTLGDAYNLPLTFRTKTVVDGTTTYTPIDITDATIFFTAKDNLKKPDSQAVLQKKILPSDHTDPTNGKTVLQIYGDDWDGVKAGEYDFDFQMVSGGRPISTKKQTLTITQDVTNDIS